MSKMRAIEQLIDRSQYFVNLTLLDQFRGYSIIQQALSREEPESSFVRLVDVCELVNDKLQF